MIGLWPIITGYILRLKSGDSGGAMMRVDIVPGTRTDSGNVGWLRMASTYSGVARTKYSSSLMAAGVGGCYNGMDALV